MIDKKRLLNIYNEDVNPNESQCLPEDGEPGLLFHEFIILLGLIAINCSGTSAIAHINIENFFVETLGFERVPEEKRRFKAFDDYLKKKASKKQIADQEEDDMDDEEEYILDDEGEDASSDELCLDEKEKEFKQFLQTKAAEMASFSIDFEEVLDVLDECCPEIPGKPEVQQIRPGIPATEKAPVRIEFGKLMPPPPGEDKKKKKQVKKAPPKKKGEKEKKPVKLRDMPLPDPNTYTLDLVRKAAADMQENVFPMQVMGDQ